MRDDDIDPRDRPERPRSEPEIIPPRRGAEGRVFVSFNEHGAQRVYIARPGPFSIFLALVFASLVLAAIVLVVLGVVLIWIPAAILIVGLLLLSGMIRYYWRRLQIWAARR